MSDHIVDAIASGAAPSEVTQEIKDILFGKASERVDTYREVAAARLFGAASEAEDVEGEEE